MSEDFTVTMMTVPSGFISAMLLDTLSNNLRLQVVKIEKLLDVTFNSLCLKGNFTQYTIKAGL